MMHAEHDGEHARLMAVGDELAEFAAELTAEIHRSVVVIVGNVEGGSVGACIKAGDAPGMAEQLRLVADDIERRHLAESS